MFWAFISGLMILAGAQLASDFDARQQVLTEDEDEMIAVG